MRTRAYRPEVLDCLEGRSLLTGVAGPSADPVVVSHRQLARVAETIRVGFDVFGSRGSTVPSLRDQLYGAAILIPFWREDGLRVSIDRTLNRMRYDLAAGVPHAVRSAYNHVVAVTRADVEARVRAGDLVVR
jgi:hypothetical protein